MQIKPKGDGRLIAKTTCVEATDGNNNLTAARLRLFASKAAADAATLGAADGADSEILRLNIDSASYAAGNATPALEVLTDMRRTSS